MTKAPGCELLRKVALTDVCRVLCSSATAGRGLSRDESQRGLAGAGPERKPSKTD